MQLELFIRTHGEKLLRLAYTYEKSQEVAEDIVQDVLLKVLKHNNNFEVNLAIAPIYTD